MNIGILLFDDVEELDFVGPWEVFTMAAMLDAGKTEVSVFTVAEKPSPVRAAKGLRVIPDRTLPEAARLDVVVVPGGKGTRREVENPKITEWLRDIAPGCRWVTSVCTGALLLHGAGLLHGRRATTHWGFANDLEARGNVTVVRDARYVRDGNVVTAAGVSAGIDMALWLVGELWDRNFGRKVQRAMEYDPAPPFAADV